MLGCILFAAVTHLWAVGCAPLGVGGVEGAGLSIGQGVGAVVVVSRSIGAAAASSLALLLGSVCSFSPHWLERAEAKWSLCWFWALNRSLCLFFFFGSLGRCFPGPPGCNERERHDGGYCSNSASFVSGTVPKLHQVDCEPGKAALQCASLYRTS